MPRDETFAIRVPTGGNAVMAMPNPWGNPHIEWTLRYSHNLNLANSGRFTAAEIVASYDYLVSEAITMKEATRRLRLLRVARAAALKAGTAVDGVEARLPGDAQPGCHACGRAPGGPCTEIEGCRNPPAPLDGDGVSGSGHQTFSPADAHGRPRPPGRV